jgi:mismatch-specific thymine-DNA glycosylase
MAPRKTSSRAASAKAAVKNKAVMANEDANGDSGRTPSIAEHFKAEKPKKVEKPKKPTKSRAKNPMSEEQKLKRLLSRFNGMTEEEVSARGLPDYLREGLDIVFIGINPSLAAAYSGKYYDGPGNHFWQALYLSGFTDRPYNPEDDHKLMDLNIGFTNVVARTTRGLADLAKSEIKEGAEILREKLSK